MVWIEMFSMTYRNTHDGGIIGFRGEFGFC